MAFGFIRPGPLNIVVALADTDPNSSTMISGLRGHYSLVCVDPVSAVDAVKNGFRPDLAIIETRVPDAADLALRLTEIVFDHSLICIALTRPYETDIPECFAHRLIYPVVASDIEQLFWWLRCDRGDQTLAPTLTLKRRQVS